MRIGLIILLSLLMTGCSRTGDTNEALLKRIVKQTFGQRRKQLRNPLKALVRPECPFLHEDFFTQRAEQLSISDFIGLTNRVEKALQV